MKEIKLNIGGVWGCITAIVIAAMLCGTVVFVSMQNNKTQWDIANKQAQATQDSASKISEGLNDLGKGICNGHNTSYIGCRY